MIVFKVWKASTLCTAMSALVFLVMTTALLLESASEEMPDKWEETVAVMAIADTLQIADAQPRYTPSIGNLFYLPAPEETPRKLQDDVVSFEVIRSEETVRPDKVQARILIYHTHTWEAYEPTQEDAYEPTERWRTKDEDYNVVRVGAELKKELTELGFEVVHDRGVFEPPVLSSAYTRSLEMLEAYAANGETFDYYIDLHRDAYSEGVYKSNTVTGENGEELARLMMLIGKGTGETGGEAFDVKPLWEENLVLAQSLTDELNAITQGLCGAVKIKTGRFNQHVSTRAILIEVGNNKNTLAQALASMPYLARAIQTTHDALSGL